MSAVAWIVLIVVAVWLVAMVVAAVRRVSAARARAVAEEERPAPRSHAEASRHG